MEVYNYSGEAPKEPTIIVFTGFIGAIIGSLLGVALWVLIGKVGFIAGIAGAAILIGAIKGYQILGHGIDKTGYIICGILALVMIFVAVHISFLLSFHAKMGANAFNEMGIINILRLFWYESSVRTAMLMELGIGYVLSILSGFRYFKRGFK